jgi:hypothetical protein
MGEKDAEWEISISALRFSCRHKGNERVHDSLQRLMRVVVSVPYRDPASDEERVLITHLFDFFDLPSDEGRLAGNGAFWLAEQAAARSGAIESLGPDQS